MTEAEIRVGAKYRCIDDKGNERIRVVDRIDRAQYIPVGDRKVYFTDHRLKTTGALFVRTFARQAKEVVA